ncbi:MAG: ornithine--oxo-acid transaminase [Elusimicrobia bacterium CG_4_9_14_3_um_filter_62_55]|nr:MAG: ornithine--oxo-acid transaminase [Elusimicrobia bacterium CG_4_10_14_0_2_um_filter_63_34]PJB24218.1 MAG: ornithine--oxo-acid transaminase [Elusimicrobia bacterium CG_4_9_14_3_um_filter_62_55]
MDAKTNRFISLDERITAHNYSPLPIVISRAKGIFAYDVYGRRYFDMLSAYSALNQGHLHPKIVAAAKRQLGKVSLTSRAFHNEQMGPFLEKLCGLAGMEMALPMNSGAEGVETAIKAMRLWGYKAKGIPEDMAEIIVVADNFHGRTTTIVGFSSDPDSRIGFGPATPGFKTIPYDDASALERAVNKNTCGFLVEPIQGEAGVRIPSPIYLKEVRRICTEQNVLFCADEIQTGLGRTGAMFCVDNSGVRPDMFVLGKALSGGLYPISAVLAGREVLGLFTPGTHGSTFGGNPLASAIGSASLDVIVKEKLAKNALEMGTLFLERLSSLDHPLIREVRGRGLLIGLEFRKPIAKDFCRLLLKGGLLAKDTHQYTVRFAPPLIIKKAQIEAAFKIVYNAMNSIKERE